MYRLPDNAIIRDLQDHEFAHAYLEDQANLRIASQIKALRMQRGWTQADLAERAGVKQSRISKLESADFESVTLTTLRKLSEAFDVHVVVAFTSVGAALVDLANLSKSKLEIEDRQRSLGALATLVGGVMPGGGQTLQSPYYPKLASGSQATNHYTASKLANVD